MFRLRVEKSWAPFFCCLMNCILHGCIGLCFLCAYGFKSLLGLLAFSLKNLSSSCKIFLLAIDFLMFCSSRNVILFFLHFWKMVLLDIRLLVHSFLFFLFNISNTSFHCLLVHRFCWEVTWLSYLDPLYMNLFFSSCCFQDFFFIPVFFILTFMNLGI